MVWRAWTVQRVLSLALVAAGALAVAWTAARGAAAQQPRERVVYMAAVEFRGSATAEQEPFPAAPLPAGGGYVLKPPDDSGRWEVEVYSWFPGTVVARQGERLTLEIVGINGREHPLHIEGYDVRDVVRRGALTRLSFTADRPGIYKIVCEVHRPAMQADLVVLPQ
ncbi:MAG TPA: cupredoxin domain-containing protein [Chloroflexota bacterium]|nr:cupredoxin domain-containing protein [Chloroflexota bacterium]HZU08233.1 cupredoxin domain-containing protein [Chloroflexota bacterium]